MNSAPLPVFDHAFWIESLTWLALALSTFAVIFAIHNSPPPPPQSKDEWEQDQW